MVFSDCYYRDGFTFEVVESGSQTELGIDAPRDLKVLQLEFSSEHNN